MEGTKERLQEAKDKRQLIKLIFIYPKTKPIFKQGYVLSVDDDSFEFKDRYDGELTFSYRYLETIKEIKENERI